MFKSSLIRTVLSSSSLSVRNSAIASIANGEALAAIQVRKYAKPTKGKKKGSKSINSLEKLLEEAMKSEQANGGNAKDEWIKLKKIPSERMPEEVLKKEVAAEELPYVGGEKLSGIPLNESMEQLLREGIITKKHYTRMLKIDAFLDTLVDPGQIGMDLFTSPKKYKKELMKRMGKGEANVDSEEAAELNELIDDISSNKKDDLFEGITTKKSKKSKKGKGEVHDVTPIPVTTHEDSKATKKTAETPQANKDDSPKQRALRKVLDELNKQLGDAKAQEEAESKQPASKSTKSSTAANAAASKAAPKAPVVDAKKAKPTTPVKPVAAPSKPAKPATPTKPAPKPAKPVAPAKASKFNKPSKKM